MIILITNDSIDSEIDSNPKNEPTDGDVDPAVPMGSHSMSDGGLSDNCQMFRLRGIVLSQGDRASVQNDADGEWLDLTAGVGEDDDAFANDLNTE